MHIITVTVRHTITLSSEGWLNLADAVFLRCAMIHSVTQEYFTVMAFMVWRTEMFVFSGWFRHLQGIKTLVFHVSYVKAFPSNGPLSLPSLCWTLSNILHRPLFSSLVDNSLITLLQKHGGNLWEQKSNFVGEINLKVTCTMSSVDKRLESSSWARGCLLVFLFF